MTGADMAWVQQRLTEFIAMTVPHNLSRDGFITGRSGPNAPESQVVAAAEVMEQIFARFYPEWRDLPTSTSYKWHRHREAAIRCLSRIQSAEELSEKLGDNAPTLSASTLHAWVWGAARSLWNSGHFREAVEAASKSVNAYTQTKVGRRDLSERDLFHQVYSDDEPKAGSPRLRLGNEGSGKSAASFRRGVRDYASGCFAAIRNPKAHDDPTIETAENEALEQLAALSLLARWVDTSSVERLADAEPG